MKKARLIKRNDAIANAEAKHNETQKLPVVKKTVEAVTDWLQNHKAESKDPRKAFAALFNQPQTQ